MNITIYVVSGAKITRVFTNREEAIQFKTEIKCKTRLTEHKIPLRGYMPVSRVENFMRSVEKHIDDVDSVLLSMKK